jgi:uncharacterized protein YecT (DUF1311 family)
MPSLARILFFPKVAPARAFLVRLAVAGAVLAPMGVAQQNQSAPAAQAVPLLQNSIAADRLIFLTGYAGRPARDLLKDKTFGRLMKEVIPTTMYHYGRDMSLDHAVDNVMGGSKLPVLLRDGRYLIVNGEQGPYLRGRGLYWFDLQEGIALGGFYFTPTNGEPSPTLTIYSNQLKETALAMSELPQGFVQDLYQWEATAKVPPVSPRYFIPADGRKYVLVHDEDYCWHPENTPAPRQDACQEENAQAAEADLNAAYFMKETHNQANATAWMVGRDQMVWLQVRARSCVGPDRLACQIRMTRERTWKLIGGPPRPTRPQPMQASR